MNNIKILKINSFNEIEKKVIKKELLEKKKIYFSFNSKNNTYIIIKILYLKGTSHYRAEIFERETQKEKVTEARFKEKFLKRLKSIIKKDFKGIKSENIKQLKLNF